MIVSIITPSFNQGQYLSETINSVRKNKSHNVEYIIMDGGSTDSSVSIIKENLDIIDYWESETDKGQSHAINKGMKRAKGDILCWLNSDDILLPGAIDLVIKTFSANSKLDIVSGYLLLIDENSKVLSVPHVLTGSKDAQKAGYVIINQQATFFKRSIIEKVDFLDENLHCAMDVDLWCKFYLQNANWKHIDKFLAGFRKHNSSKGSKNEWWDLYQNEKRIVYSKYTNIRANTKLERFYFKYKFFLPQTFRKLRTLFANFKYKGKKISEILNFIN